MCRHAAAEPPKVNPLSFVPESLTQPGRESDRDVSMWTFSERRLRGMTLRCLVIVLGAFGCIRIGFMGAIKAATHPSQTIRTTIHSRSARRSNIDVGDYVIL